LKVIEIRNVHQALYVGMAMIGDWGVERHSRAGDVLVAQEPVTTVYHRPTERVLFWPDRDANPYFHFMEGLWMLAGRNDVQWLSKFNSRMKNFSDNGVRFHGAYGYRWRRHFTHTSEPGVVITDQLPVIARKLRENPDDRRCVLSIWDASCDLGKDSKDIPCNLAVHFSINANGHLDMIVFNRSNDIIWGCYGANAVHFSMLHEVMAAWLAVPVGIYRQVSSNWHAYIKVMAAHADILKRPYDNPYEDEIVAAYPMVSVEIPIWFQDLEIFMEEGPIVGFRDPFFRRVVVPIWNSWFAYKKKDIDGALEIIDQCQATDWKRACREWMIRRQK